jgi:hypothetical protein
MMAKKSTLILFVGLLYCFSAAAQDIEIISNGTLSGNINARVQTDTLFYKDFDEKELDAIPSLRQYFDKINKTYKTPKQLSQKLATMSGEEQTYLSAEALRIKNWQRDPDTYIPWFMTFEDTSIVNPLFVPIVFRDGLFSKDMSEAKLKDMNLENPNAEKYRLYTPDTTLFAQETAEASFREDVYNYMRINHPTYFKYSDRDMPKGKVEAGQIHKEAKEDAQVKVSNDVSFEDVSAPVRFLPNRRYWTSNFESSIQFSQNYVSPNWHKGGVSNLNLYQRQYFKYNYNKDKVQITNDVEWKTSFYTAPKDTLRDYKVGDDVFRINSNIGYQAFKKWYYTYDITFQTQLFTNYQENTDVKLASFLSPFSVNMGVGMKYELNKSFSKVRNRKVALSINLAPLSYTFMYALDKDIQLSRHGFEKDPETGEYKRMLNQVGSTVNSTLNFQINKNVSWYSRLYYFTNYERVLGEFENRFNFTLSRFFSTTITLNLRFDDAVTKTADYDTYLQINELFSFGFNYKW